MHKTDMNFFMFDTTLRCNLYAVMVNFQTTYLSPGAHVREMYHCITLRNVMMQQTSDVEGVNFLNLWKHF